MLETTRHLTILRPTNIGRLRGYHIILKCTSGRNKPKETVVGDKQGHLLEV